MSAWSLIKKPYICLAPMDGVTNSAYRQIVKKINPKVIMFSEFTSAEGIIRSDQVKKKLAFENFERPYFVQLFGSDPKAFALAAKISEDMGVTGIDINMGCPAKKIVNSQHGSALMKEPEKAVKIIEQLKASTNLEISVKTRLGWENSNELISFAKRLESAGVSLLTIHGRTYRQAFKGEADWEPIYQLKNALNIPVIGNGDCADIKDGLKKLNNLDGFMIGRSAIGNPWAFLDTDSAQPSFKTRIDTAIEHYHLMRKTMHEGRAVREFRKFLKNYVQEVKNAKHLRMTLMECETEKQFLDTLESIKNLNPEVIAGAA